MSQGFKEWKRYPAYKNSGIDWLGEIPAHWEVKKLKYISFIIMGQSPSSDDYNYNEDGIPFLQGNAEFGEKNPIPKIFCHTANKYAELGDILLSVRAPVGALNIADQKYGIGRGLCSVRYNNKLLSKEYTWYLLKVVKIKLNLVSTGSIYNAVSVDDVSNIECVVPPLSEQQQIAQFLDRETYKIDTLIAKKERFIELLKEKRKALISHVVTKGLDPNAPMKDSGIEWLGSIPAHWEVKKLKYVFVLQRGYDLSKEQIIKGVYPVCASNGIIGWHNAFNVKGPSITVGRSGSVGEVNYIENDFWAHNTALFVKNFFNSIPRFVFYLLLILDTKRLSFGSVVGTLNRNYIHELLIAIPPLSEQQAIAQFLDREINKIDTLITKTKTSIEKYKEYRTALISSAVTGKIDIREIDN